MGMVRAESNVAGHRVGEVWDTEAEGTDPKLVEVLLNNGQITNWEPEVAPLPDHLRPGGAKADAKADAATASTRVDI